MAYQGRWASKFSIGARTRGLKMNGERFELANANRHVTIVSGEMYPECGIDRRVRRTRSVAAKEVWASWEIGCNVTQEFADAEHVRLGTEREEPEPNACGYDRKTVEHEACQRRKLPLHSLRPIVLIGNFLNSRGELRCLFAHMRSRCLSAESKL
jgi:hypothetical protein